VKACLAVLFLFTILSPAQAADIKGKVVSATGGEPLRQVRVSILEQRVSTITADDGAFTIANLPPGKYTLQVTAVGYRLVNATFEITSESDSKDFSITLAPDNLRRVDVVEVHGDIFQADNPAIPSQLNLTARELKEAATVVGNDPFRAVQALPGVSPSDNNDFFGQFSVWGATFDRVGIYVDNVLTPQPFNTIPGFRDGASLSVFSAETLQDLSLMPVAFPLRFADLNGAALAITTREGSRTRPHFTVSAGLAVSEVVGEGGLGSAGKGSWLASARKSYLNYLYRHRGGDPSVDVAFEDADLKLNYDLARNHSVSFYFLAAHTDLDQVNTDPGPNSLSTGGNDFNLARVGWRYAVTPHLLLDSEGAYIRQRFDTRNPFDQVLSTDYYGEWVGGTHAVWNWRKDHVLEAGYTARRLRDSGYSLFFSSTGADTFDVANGTGPRQSGYAQQSSSFFKHRVHVMAGVRWDRITQVDFQPVSSQASAAWQIARRTQLQFGFGRYAQLPRLHDLSCLPLPAGIPSFDAISGVLLWSNHYSAGLEQRVGENLRVRVEGFDREDHELLGRRLLTQSACGPVEPDPQLFPEEFHQHSRGMQVMLQRRSANRLSGWAGYTLASSQARFNASGLLVATGPFFNVPTPADQRHTFNAFGMYRLTPSINLSAKALYGSGVPIGNLTFQAVGDRLVPVGPSHARLGPYERLDVRFDKAWAFSRWKMTLYAEGLNMTNHDNPRFLAITIDPTTGKVLPVLASGLPITPTAGITFEF
jgi:hypothetical protein